MGIRLRGREQPNGARPCGCSYRRLSSRVVVQIRRIRVAGIEVGCGGPDPFLHLPVGLGRLKVQRENVAAALADDLLDPEGWAELNEAAIEAGAHHEGKFVVLTGTDRTLPRYSTPIILKGPRRGYLAGNFSPTRWAGP